MTLFNVIDHRKRPYRFRKVNVVVEAAYHDNSVADADQIDHPATLHETQPDYEEREHITVHEAIQWANNFQNPVTLYIYDEDAGIYPHEESKE